MSEMPVHLAAEGRIDIALLRRLLRDQGLTSGDEHGGRGKAQLDMRLRGYNRGAQRYPWVVLRDLDNDAACAAEMVAKKLPKPERWMVFRIAVRQVEAWLMADHGGLARTYRIAPASIPSEPEALPDSKQTLLAVLGQSKTREIRETMVRLRSGLPLNIGPQYNSQLEAFVANHWDPQLARKRSRSLDRTLARLSAFADLVKQEWPTK